MPPASTKDCLPSTIRTGSQLDDLLSEPTAPVVEMIRELEGPILFLGAAGKIGPSLARMARRASDLAGTARRIIAVSRFGKKEEEAGFRRQNVETIRCDLLDDEALSELPDAPNIVYLAGLKFGSTDRLAETWAINSYLPARICRRFSGSRIVAFSTGAVYGLTPSAGNGSRETDATVPVGEYAMSCLGRERMFEYSSAKWNIPVVLIRLFYACELRYGVLVDLARNVLAGDPIDLSMGYFNVIWQGDNNAMTLLAFEHAASPPFILNVTGPEILSIREVAERLGKLLGKKPKFQGVEQEMSCLGDARKSHELFGRPRIDAERLITWVADWVKRGNEYLGKPTHFEVRDGKY